MSAETDRQIRECQVLMREYEAALSAYAHWYADYRARHGIDKETVDPTTGEVLTIQRTA